MCARFGAGALCCPQHQQISFNLAFPALFLDLLFIVIYVFLCEYMSPS